jgi:hypothetical protein
MTALFKELQEKARECLWCAQDYEPTRFRVLPQLPELDPDTSDDARAVPPETHHREHHDFWMQVRSRFP